MSSVEQERFSLPTRKASSSPLNVTLESRFNSKFILLQAQFHSNLYPLSSILDSLRFFFNSSNLKLYTRRPPQGALNRPHRTATCNDKETRERKLLFVRYFYVFRSSLINQKLFFLLPIFSLRYTFSLFHSFHLKKQENEEISEKTAV